MDSPPDELSRSVREQFAVSIGNVLTEQQQLAAQELVRILGDKALHTFTAMYLSPDPELSAKGIALLCSMNNGKADALLLSSLSQVSIQLMGRIGEPALRFLKILAENPTSRWQVHAVEALGEIHSHATTSILIHFLSKRYPDVVNDAVKNSLVKISELAVIPLINILGEDKFNENTTVDVKLQAVQVLKKIKPLPFERTFNLLPQLNGRIYEEIASLLGEIGKEENNFSFLRAELINEQTDHKIAAVNVLGESRVKETLPYLIDAFQAAYQSHDKKLQHVIESALIKVGRWVMLVYSYSALKPFDQKRYEIEIVYELQNIKDKIFKLVLGGSSALEGPSGIVVSKGSRFNNSWEALMNLPQSYFIDRWRTRRVASHVYHA